MVELVVLGSGSRGNSTLVRAGGKAILIDAGLSARAIVGRLEEVGQDPRRIEAILLTHEHADHVNGLAVFLRRHPTVVAGNQATLAAVAGAVDAAPEQFCFEAARPFTVGRFEVTAFPVPHDSADPVGFVLEAEGARIGYATDLGHVTRLVEARLAYCAAVVLEANHDRQMLMDGPYPWSIKQRVASRHGHLSNDHVAAAAPIMAAGGVEHLVLAHLSETNNDPQLARSAAEGALAAAGLGRVSVEVACQARPAARIRL
jgi:phosphoribosyl 1,2-cyclic phosphodiesterase